MASIKLIKAYSNGEIAFISWVLNDMIPNCLGFEITRLYPDDPSQNVVLPAWVAFKGQSNKKWLPQNTTVWPIQKLSWKDLTLRKSRDSLTRHQDNTKVQYLVRPIVPYDPNLPEAKTTLPKTYEGAVVRLSYYDEGAVSNVVDICLQYGDIRATFTNGILATQWLAHAMKVKSFRGIKTEIKDPKSKIRKYLTGDVLDTLLMLLDKASNTPKASLKMAIYELDDEELFKKILSVKTKVDIILSNTSLDKTSNKWDTENAPQRAKLHKEKVKIADRMFNNANSIGHNKFVIYLENNKPLSVMTGSTNWTSNGLCAQSNNAVLINSSDLASLYNDYFEQLRKDNKLFIIPKPLSAATNNKQGPTFRSFNRTPKNPVILKDKTSIKVWFSPNTPNVTVDKTKTPVDLSDVYSYMRKADKAIFFAVFLPGRANSWRGSDIMTNIITEAITLGEKDTSLLVYGSISDPTAMPNYMNPQKGVKNPPTPFTYDEGKMHIVRAANIRNKDSNKAQVDFIGDFETELLSLGHAIIHDKIVVIDPFSDNGKVIFGSHNLGFKASSGNDENLLIIENNQALVQAYALHVLDIFEHYRFRAVQAELQDEKKPTWDGFLSLDGTWLQKAMQSGGKGDLADYMTS